MKKIKIKSRARVIAARAFLLLACCSVSAGLYAQERPVKLPAGEMTVEQALEQIEEQTNLIVGVNHKRFDVSRRMTVPQEEMPVEELLQLAVAGTGHKFVRNGTHVIIVTDNTPSIMYPAAGAQVVESRTVSGEETTGDTVVQQFQVAEAVIGEPELVKFKLIAGNTAGKTFSFSTDGPATFKRVDGRQPGFAIKTNLLHGIGTLTPNMGLEFGMGKRTTLEITGGWNPWNRKGSASDNKKHIHTYIQPEFRWWTCERFDGHFFGVHVLGMNYNISRHDLPFVHFKKDYRYEGYAVGAGISYGYMASLSRTMGLEFTVGVGALRLDYDRYSCDKCSDDKQEFTKYRFAPTKAGISLVFIIK